MTLQDIAAPLAATLAERGYETLTSVQNAVLEPDLRGRDLLVSAQTGSGKTVAFGLAAAPDLLGGADVMPQSDAPLALAIAPTRELALQVATELSWLYRDTGAQVATCVGGMDYRTERRALARGAQIVVGTPGRLRDHIERGSLDLSALRVAVLDEADEMLDLGFREDLEFILGSAPEQRRTLMFSATVPPAIEKLARDFQRDGRRIAAMGEARQHGDITYRALTVAARDRENAIFNLLRYYEARTAIIFCKTRANVNHLLARMGNRGFRVVSLSGELSQQERTHALQALRDGRARVCIATDVAARGIDLPGLELVIHADLPTNYEILLHRSGRTGRAGAKGVSALIVPPAEYKKAQRLLQGAKVTAEWGQAPSADEVTARDDARMMQDPALNAELEDMTVADALLERLGPRQLAAAFVQLWREGRPPPEELSDMPAPGQAPPPRPAREFGASIWFTLSVGHSGRAEARWLLPKICEAGSITRDAIGAIRVREHETHVQIATGDAPRFGDEIELEPGLVMRRMRGEPDLTPQAPRPRLDKTDRKPHRKGPRTAEAPAAPPAPAAARETPAPAEKPARKWTPVQAEPEQAAPDHAPRPDRAPKPDDGKAHYGKPDHGKSDHGKPGSGKPGNGKPAYAKPAYAKSKPWDKSAKPGAAAKPFGKPAKPGAAAAKPYGKPASRPGAPKPAAKGSYAPKGKPARPGAVRSRPGGDAPPRRPKNRI
ncbi:DEAD/DEAH box helicase [Paracoccus jeotgali]|uniref:DEAD/DEAH box helicase n=1 Tax=Paracoccus jeotgali TaxID=2065379 RepID=A0A2K9MII5_9RHOB|nr:DEAD/DEAH box helicase [Paracoccus jeotgali]AUM75424.1 DEAD/DEAH box helicase [Paracoccus jeotgali]